MPLNIRNFSLIKCYHFHAGLANFASQFEYSYGNSSDVNDYWHLDYRGSTNKVFDIGLILGIGLQFDVSQKGFIGADLTIIPKKEVEYEYKSHSNITVSHLDEKIDLKIKKFKVSDFKDAELTPRDMLSLEWALTDK